MKTTISVSEARKRIFDITKKVQNPDCVFTLTENGKPSAVILSADEFESWLETLEVSREYPDLKKDIKGLEKDLRDGKTASYTSLASILKKKNLE